ncbi:transcriptional regulator containing an amidase domain and an AraC-type DNA-binding HTH domain [Pseudomonas sp. GM49]|uniref:GlxA family transcriptional regulator n=1 Tax=Pseudomonas sp. GM49 TaxID=1144331 RepID=UPI00026FF5EF|nr:helix-turn-helix domain-containing protein [Pseudomonas sp. GM49]EJM56725.1 transcriptional regulator containing an amidase domain and an AraC-type DNA-binding HTH domain [Pseudomonas sp. GM49]
MTSKTKPGQPSIGRTPKRVVILGLPPVDGLDVIGPAEVFSLANTLHDGAFAPYVLELVCAGVDPQMASSTGIGLMAHTTLEHERHADKAIDTLIVATGWQAIDQLDGAAIEWIRTRSGNVRRVCSICVGAFALADAGLLDGRRATTHWRMARDLAERYPKVQVDPNPIWIKDGNVYTSAGISAGIDLALALVSEDLGDDAALDIAKNLVLFLRRPGGQAQFSVALQSQQVPGSNLDELCHWISEHLGSQLTVEILADRFATSVRTLIRIFQRELQTTPARYVEDVRLEAACRELELGGRSMEEVARRCGYHSVDVLRKVFVRRLGVSPREYAQRFAPDVLSARP